MPTPSFPVEIVALFCQSIHEEHRWERDQRRFGASVGQVLTGRGHWTLVACSRVSRAWQHASFPVLLAHIAFSAKHEGRNDIAFAFSTFTAPRWAHCIRSLTLDLDSKPLPRLFLNLESNIPEGGFGGIDHKFSRLFAILPNLRALYLFGSAELAA